MYPVIINVSERFSQGKIRWDFFFPSTINPFQSKDSPTVLATEMIPIMCQVILLLHYHSTASACLGLRQKHSQSHGPSLAKLVRKRHHVATPGTALHITPGMQSVSARTHTVHKQTQACTSSTEWLALAFSTWQRLWHCGALVVETADAYDWLSSRPHVQHRCCSNSRVSRRCCQLTFPCSLSSIKLTCHVACGMQSFRRPLSST